MPAHTFNDPEKRNTLIEYIKQGYSYTSIAKYMCCDHTTVRYHAQKILNLIQKRTNKKWGRNLVKEKRAIYIESVKEEPIKPVKPADIYKEEINLGKQSYADYVKAERERKSKLKQTYPHIGG